MVIALAVALATTACGGDDDDGGGHTHTYSTAWSFDATRHWRECTANDGAKSAVANHTTGNTCSVCGYDSTATLVKFSSVSANGSASATTTTLTLTFSQAINGLSASNINLSGVAGVQKGTLSGSGPTYTLGISGFTAGGTLSVAVSRTGYNISGSPKSTAIYYYTSSGGGDIIINIAAIAGVTAPVQGATPVTAITANDQFTGTVTWNGTPATFAYATEYTATITLSAKSGYTLQGVSANFFTVAGAISVNNAVNSGVVTATFPQTENNPSLSTLTGNITISPDTGVTVGTELSAAYSGDEAVSFQWHKNGNNIGTASTTNPNTYTPTEEGSYTVTVSAEGYNPKPSTAVTVTIITYTIAQTGGTASGNAATADSTEIVFAFSAPVSLTANDITVGGAATKGAGALSGSETSWTLPITVSAMGTASVSINKSGVEAGTKGVFVYKAGQSSAGTAGLAYELITSGKNANTYRVSKGTAAVAGNDYAPSVAIVIPAIYNGLPVTEIGSPTDSEATYTGAFLRCYTITSITIPDSVTYIGKNAFYYCTSLTSITIPASVTEIDYEAFRAAEIETVTFAAGSLLTTIGGRVFRNCTKITSITIPAGVTTVGTDAFSLWTASQTIRVPFANAGARPSGWDSGWNGGSANVVYSN